MRRWILTCLGLALLLAGCSQSARTDSPADHGLAAEPERGDPGLDARAVARGTIDAVWYTITLGYDERQSQWYRKHRPLAYREHQAHMRARGYEWSPRLQPPAMGCNFSYTPDLSGISFGDIGGVGGK